MISDFYIAHIFNKNTIELFRQVADIELKDGKVSLDSGIKFYDGIITAVSLSGVLSGQIIINVSYELARLICLKVMGGIPIVDVSKEAKETIFNLFKLIIGNSCVSLYENGVSMKVISSYVLEGRDCVYMSLYKKTIMIKYNTLLEKMGMIILLDINEK